MNADTVSDVLPPQCRSAAFDGMAEDYDQIFTHSALGKAHRSLVYESLRGHIRRGERILDLNCGTGEDAIYLASLGMSVVACDISEGMIAVAQQKATESGYGSAISVGACANERLNALVDDGPFDAALSNFGGLNCSADLVQVARNLSRLVRPGGEVFLCMLGPVCAWEILWYAVKGNWRKALRRLKPGGTRAIIGGASIYIHYPSVRDMRQAFAPWFRLSSWRGIGVALPPSWLASALQNHPRLLSLLKSVDQSLGGLPVVRGLADHIFFQFVREEK